MSKYTLKFTGRKGDSADKTDFSVSSTQPVNTDTHLNVPYPESDSLKDIKFQLTELRLDKRNYAPCRADAVVSVSGCPLDASIDDISALFAYKSVEIVNQAQLQNLQTAPTTVGSDYFVYQVRPVLQFDKAKGDTVPCTVSLVIYSRDYLLTLDRFSKAYLSRKLSSDILASTLKYGDANNAGILGNCMVDFEDDVKRLQFTSLDDKELIQPYHVQYNEDFYSFVARIAARHGEFLFFEDGKLNLGLPHGKDAISLDTRTAEDNSPVTVVLSMERATVGDSPLTVDSYYSNYLRREENMYDTIYATTDIIKDQNAVAGKPIEVDANKLYFNEDAYDEYFDIVGTGKDTAPYGMIMEQSGGYWLLLILKKIIPIFPSSSHDTKFSRAAMIFEVAKSIAMEEGAMAKRVNLANSYYLEKRVNIPVTNKDEQYGGNDNDKLCQFASYTGARPEDGGSDSLQQYNFMREFYSSLRELELAVSKKIVRMGIRPGIVSLNVGDTVTFSGKNYLIVGVSSEYAYKPAADTVSIDVIEVADSDKPVCPPYDRCSEHEKAAPQVAVVSNHQDPRYLNRVRIKYPWQPDSDLASPWVRTSTPLASPNGGACSFLMKAGSEVMVDYIDGNIDRPYIVGSLFTTRTNPKFYNSTYTDREIRSESGARLKLEMGNVVSYIKSFVPLVNTVTPFLKPFLGAEMAKLAAWMPSSGKAAGKASLTDAFGFFEISGDSAERKVVINSTIGTVTISALTGITISAPLGDVTIEGHNINMRAANNITIESGLNIKHHLDTLERQKRHKRLETDPDTGAESSAGMVFLKDVGEILAKTVADMLLGSIDMSLLRTVYNAVVAPKEGTLKIKSHRFVNIEAGAGRAMDSAGGFAPKNLDAKHQVSLVDNFAAAATESLKKRLSEIIRFYEHYDKCQTNIKYHLKLEGEAVLRKCFEKGDGTGLTDADLYDPINPIDDPDTLFDTGRRLATGQLVVSCSNLREYFNGYKKSSGTFKSALKPFSDEHQAILVDICMSSAVSSVFMTGNEKIADTVLRFAVGGEDLLVAEMSKFRKALFRLAILKLTGEKGFCLKWNKDYVLGNIRVDQNGVEPWNDPIRNIHVNFDDTSYRGSQVISENFKNPYSIKAAAVNSVWNPLQRGRVLISESAGSTLGITPNHNEWEAMDNLSVEFVRRYLAQR